MQMQFHTFACRNATKPYPSDPVEPVKKCGLAVFHGIQGFQGNGGVTGATGPIGEQSKGMRALTPTLIDFVTVSGEPLTEAYRLIKSDVAGTYVYTTVECTIPALSYVESTINGFQIYARVLTGSATASIHVYVVN